MLPRDPKRVMAVVTVLAVGLILFLRKSYALIHPQFFAEDGVIFFLDAYEKGPRAFLIPYAGYLHFLPRTAAWLATFIDPLRTPAIYNVFSLMMNLSAVVFLFSSRIQLPGKPALALAYALVPHTGEVLLNLTNIQWSLALVLVLLLIGEDARTGKQRLFDCMVLVLCGLTGPFLVFLLPLFAIRAIIRRSRESMTLLASSCLIAGIQIFYLLKDRAIFVRSTPRDPKWLLSVMSGRVYATFWAGYGFPAISSHIAWLMGGAAATALLGYWMIKPGKWLYERRMLAAAWLCFVVPVGAKFLREAGAIATPTAGDRYFFLSHVLLAWLLVILCVQCAGWARIFPVTLLAIAFGFNWPYLRSAPMHDYRWAQYVPAIREGKALSIPINPPGWVISSTGKNSRR